MTDSVTDNFKSRDASASKNYFYLGLFCTWWESANKFYSIVSQNFPRANHHLHRLQFHQNFLLNLMLHNSIITSIRIGMTFKVGGISMHTFALVCTNTQADEYKIQSGF